MTLHDSIPFAADPRQTAISADSDGHGGTAPAFDPTTRALVPDCNLGPAARGLPAAKPTTDPTQPLRSLWPQTLGKTTDRVAG